MNLPKVRIIGDSISMGYLDTVKKKLADIAEVSRPEGNCASTKEGLANLSTWLEPGPWDLIQFNWGLHDLKYVLPGSDAFADPRSDAADHKVPPQIYRRNLMNLGKQLKETGAKLLWCSTTPVPAGAQGRNAGDAERFNGIASSVMESLGIEILDLYGYALPCLSNIQKPQDVHFTDEGSRLLGEFVARELRNQIGISS